MNNELRREAEMSMARFSEEISSSLKKNLKWNEIDSNVYTIEYRAPLFKDSDIPVLIGIGLNSPEDGRYGNDSTLEVNILVVDQLAENFKTPINMEDEFKYSFNRAMMTCISFIDDVL